MEQLLTDAFVEKLTRKVAEQVTQQMRLEYGFVVSELAKTRQQNELLQRQVVQAEHEAAQKITKATEQLSDAAAVIEHTRLLNRKAEALLNRALKDYGE